MGEAALGGEPSRREPAIAGGPSRRERAAAEALAEPAPQSGRNPRLLVIYQLLVIVPLLLFVGWNLRHEPDVFLDPKLLLWAAAIAVVDLLPVPAWGGLHFSLSFPLQLAVALIYPPGAAAAAALVGTSDIREFRGEIKLIKALFIRSQIAVSVVAESQLFHATSSLTAPWYELGLAVIAVTIVGYSVNCLLVAEYLHIDTGQPLERILRQMHVGIFGEFLLAYMGLALFGVLIALFFLNDGIWAIAVFVAPLAFARQMFARTHSLTVATEELRARQAENEHQALHDPLTGLPNRNLFLVRLRQAIDAAVGDGSKVAVLVMDLDEFKEVNDTLGHLYGDALLREVAGRLGSDLRGPDTIARLGGDEFGLVMPGVPDLDTAHQVADRLLRVLEQPFNVEGLALDVSASIGISVYPEHSDSVDGLIRNADVAMYRAKDGRTGIEVYTSEADEYTPARLTLMGQVRPAIEDDQFVLHFQPKVHLSDGRVRGVEALVRWQHPERGLLMPDSFIPLTERTVLLRPLTLHILHAALRACRSWHRAGLDVGVAINLSPRSLLDGDLAEQLVSALDRWEVPPFFLRIEITENSLMADSVRSMEVLARLAEVGVGLSIDDFGTGYSSLSYLTRLPVDEIKIDRSFVMSMDSNANDLTIVRATIDLAHNLGLRVVAEGVETEAACRQLIALGCDAAQGYFLSRPIAEPDLPAWLEGHARGLTLPWPATTAGARMVGLARGDEPGLLPGRSAVPV